MGKEVSLWKLWNTWDVRCVNCVVFLPLAFEFRVGTFYPAIREYIAEYRRDGVRLGVHSPECVIASLQLEHRENSVELRFGKPDPYVVVGEVRALDVKDEFFIVFEALNIWDGNGVLSYDPSQNIVTSLYSNKDMVIVASFNRSPSYVGVYPDEQSVRLDLEAKGFVNSISREGSVVALQYPLKKGESIHFVVAVAETIDLAMKNVKEFLPRVREVLNHVAEEYDRRRVKIVGGEFDGCAQAVIDAISWNTVWDPYNKRVYTPVSRVWAHDFWNGYVMFEWDTFFNALLASIEDCEIAEANIKAILSEMLPRGVVPNYVAAPSRYRRTGASADRAQPPVASYLVWKVYLRCRNLSMLRWAYPYLKRFHEWWFRARDGNNDGLLEWGSDPIGTDPSRHTLQSAKFESGLDNSPMYDEAIFVKDRNVMNLADIGLNSLYAVDALALAMIARELNLIEDAEKFLKEYEEMKRRINDVLWCEEEGLYLNKFWDGKFSKRKSPTCFYPLIAGIPDIKRAERMVYEHLLNPKEFWGEYVIPSIARDDPAYRDNDYWRGRIWGPMNFLVYEGLKRYGFDDISYEFALKSVKLFMKEWREKSHYHENYNAETGEGDDVSNSDPFYSWGALLALIGVEELFDVREDGLIFGSLGVQRINELHNYHVGNDIYSIKVGPNIIEARRNGKLFFRANKAIAVKSYKKLPNSVEFDVKGDGLTKISVIEFNPNTHVEVCIDVKCMKIMTDESGAVSFEIELEQRRYIHIKISVLRSS